jgi:putative peptidoglycan lipid II flippase
MYNVGIVLGIYLFVQFAPHFGVYALSYAVLLGTFFHFFTQLIGIYNLHDRDFSWSFKINNYVKDIAKLSLPRIIGLGVEQIAIMFNTFWGFTLGTGALSVFKFATTLHLVPVDLISGSFLQVIFPRLNEKAQEDDEYESLNKLYWRTLLFLCLISIPIIILFIVLKLPIVRLVFGAGRFTWNATVITSFTLVFLAPAILLQALAALNIRTFYAINNTKLPLLVSIIGVVLNIVFSIGFTNFFSHYGDMQTLLREPSTWIANILNVASWFIWKNGSFAAVAGLALGITLGLAVEVFSSFVLLSKKTHLWQFAQKNHHIISELKTMVGVFILTIASSYLTYKVTDALFDTSRSINVFFVATITSVITLGLYTFLSRKLVFQYVDFAAIKSRITKILRPLIQKNSAR